MRIEHRLAADVPDHRPVTPQQELERRLVTMLDEVTQDLPIRHPCQCPFLEHPRHLLKRLRSHIHSP